MVQTATLPPIAPGTFATTRTVALALWVLLISLTAPFVVPLILLFVDETDDNLPTWAWPYDTPDEASLVGMYEASIESIHVRYGWYVAAWIWFGFRNRCHGLASHYSVPALAHWAGDMPGSDNAANVLKDESPDAGAWINARRVGPFVAVVGWQVYASNVYTTGLEYRPIVSMKCRPRHG